MYSFFFKKIKNTETINSPIKNTVDSILLYPQAILIITIKVINNTLDKNDIRAILLTGIYNSLFNKIIHITYKLFVFFFINSAEFVY
ncbi:hypothetical protein BvCmsKKP001_04574 [Escherichia coli]|nr:hypothetical protein BvCmsKKP001_04574 [Escherichia coli]